MFQHDSYFGFPDCCPILGRPAPYGITLTDSPYLRSNLKFETPSSNKEIFLEIPCKVLSWNNIHNTLQLFCHTCAADHRLYFRYGKGAPRSYSIIKKNAWI